MWTIQPLTAFWVGVSQYSYHTLSGWASVNTVTILSNFVDELHIVNLFKNSVWCPHGTVNHVCVCLKRLRVTLVTVMALFQLTGGKVNAHGLQDIATSNYNCWLFSFLRCYFVTRWDVSTHTESCMLAVTSNDAVWKKNSFFVVKKSPILKKNKSERSVN
jgi:hypothetical protein